MSISKILFSLVGVAAMLTSCGRDRSYSIEGALYGGKNFEDQMIYLVPFSGATTENIDSAVVHNSRFKFTGTVEHEGVYIIRMRPMMRLFINELIVIKEPGRIRTRLSSTSSAKGTPLNDSLQAWREYKQMIDDQMVDIRKQMKKATGEELARLKAQSDSLKSMFDRRNKQSITLNNNAFGEFLDKYVR